VDLACGDQPRLSDLLRPHCTGVHFLILAFRFVLTPIDNSYSRTEEYEADIFGLNADREPDAEAEVDLKLADYRKLDPAPLEEIIFYDHPSGRVRIYAAMRRKAEHLHEQTGR
jgi:STE24 endopeptidase